LKEILKSKTPAILDGLEVLVGDIDFEHAANKAAWITPVPGAVGPMTWATLMLNTTEAAGVFISEPHRQSPDV